MKKVRVILSTFAICFAIAGAVASSSVLAEETVGGVQNDTHSNCNVALSSTDTAIGCATNYPAQQCRLSDGSTPAFKSNGTNCVTAILRKN
jgi:hypothetical protein